MTSEAWHGIAVGLPLVALMGYLVITDTFGAVRRHAERPDRPLPLMVFARLNLCGMFCFMIVLLGDVFSAFNVPWYWLAGISVVIGFISGRWWEKLKCLDKGNL